LRPDYENKNKKGFLLLHKDDEYRKEGVALRAKTEI
jgi:hypothetical protein